MYNSLFSHVSGNPRYMMLGSLTTGAVFRVFVTCLAIDRDWTYPGIRFILGLALSGSYRTPVPRVFLGEAVSVKDRIFRYLGVTR